MCVNGIAIGPIGLELAQAMARFGSKVTVFVRGTQLLPKEDRDAAEIVHKAMMEDNVIFHFNTTYVNVTSSADDAGNKYFAPFNVVEVNVTVDGVPLCVPCDALLIATGRTPNVENMGKMLTIVAMI